MYLQRSEDLRLDNIYKLSAASHVFNILKHTNRLTLKSSLYKPYPCHNYQTFNNIGTLLPLLVVEGIRINSRFHFVKVWLEDPTLSKANDHTRRFKITWQSCI